MVESIGMAQTLHKNTVEKNYLDQMRDLVLRETSNLDCTILLFGSRARGEHRRSSDIDIGFSGLSEPLFTKVRDRLLSELEESVIPHHVDLVNMDFVSKDFRDVAMEKVIVWKQSSRAN
jgi:predicted nucleotidyltransferase